MNSDQLKQELERARRELSRQGSLIFFDRDKYQLEQRLNNLLEGGSAEIQRRYEAADRELALFEGFAMIEEFTRKSQSPEKYIGALLFSTYALASTGITNE